ncbi:MAG: hypothetical protein AAF366_04025 [Pseudomonadota bacterium]
MTDIPILSDILGDTIAGAEAIVTGADIVPNRLTGRALSGMRWSLRLGK